MHLCKETRKQTQAQDEKKQAIKQPLRGNHALTRVKGSRLAKLSERGQAKCQFSMERCDCL
jgi:hypothetical protein